LGRRAVQKARIGGNGEKRTNRADEFDGRERRIRRGWKEGEDDGVEDPREGGTGGGALECRMEGVGGAGKAGGWRVRMKGGTSRDKEMGRATLSEASTE
jgi:hypothetical protein